MSTANDFLVETWGQLSDILFEDSREQLTRSFRSPFIYRGISDSSYIMSTSLQRHEIALETDLLNALRQYAYHDVGLLTSDWHVISLAQHHGLPTRLLDWSYSPLVALHFATANIYQYDRDAAIWKVNYGETIQYLPQKFQKALNSAKRNTFTVELMDNVAKTLQDFEDFTNPQSEFIVLFEPPSLDIRIVNQYALFSMFPNSNTICNEWLLKRPNIYTRIIIPANLKAEIRDKLDQMNINERILFPGLDGLCSWLRRAYGLRKEREI